MIHGDGILQLLMVPCIVTELAMILRGEFFYKMLPKCLLSSREKKNILFAAIKKYGCL